ncbi:MAG: lipopolysaccharide transport periplasmic protein LptA [Gammaproteobacteria bacterium]|nr:lipopolysaccharide transport periplasmic protein LptA [Gammaproteobacteria bacterium]
MKLLVKFILPALSLLGLASAIAKTSDSEQPMYIEADSVEIREQEGISIYKGNVIIKRGSTVIKGQLIHIYQKNNIIDRITMLGDPASFRQLNDQDQEILAESLDMEYQDTGGILTLNKQALLVQHNNRFTGDHIIYNTSKDLVQAGSENQDKGNGKRRVTVTIQPEKPKQQKQSEQ